MSEPDRISPTALGAPARLAALAKYGDLVDAPTAALDSLVRLAAEFCEAPIGLVTLVDDARQVFLASRGFDGPRDAPLESGFCPLVVEASAPVVIPDTLADAGHASNLAAREGGMRFYAGVPLLTSDAHALGTLCVLDRSPRPAGLTSTQLEVLQALAAQVITQFELRRSLARQAELLSEQEATIRIREALARVQTAIFRAEGDLDAVLHALVDGALQAVPAAEAGVLELIAGDELEYRRVGGTLERHAGMHVPLEGSLAGHCVRRNAPMLVHDACDDPYVIQSLIERLGLRAAVLAPIARGDHVLGVLKLQSSKPGAFGRRELETVTRFAEAATTGLTEVRAADAQRAAATGARRLQAIFDSATEVAIVATDRDGRITDWNTGAERALGWTADEMRGQSAERFFTPEDRAIGRIETEMRLSLEQGRASDERWHLRKDGIRFWASGEMMPLRSDAGDAVGFLKVLRNRTTEHMGAKALQDSERRLSGLLSATSDAFFSLSADWQELRQLNGGRFLPDTHEARRDWLADYVHPDDLPLVRDAIAEAIRTRKAYEVEHRVMREGGDVGWTHSRAVPLLGETGEVIEWFGAATDVTARRTAEEELRRLAETLEQRVDERTSELLKAEEALRQSQKLEAVGQLTGGVAHDFNNLLTIIRSSVDFLKREDLPPARRSRYVEAISETVERAAKLTSQLLAFARRQPLKPEVFDVNARVADVSDLIRPLVGARIGIKVEPCARACHTLADVSQFETALVNLAVNARDAMNGEGRLTFSVKEVQEVPAIRGHAGAKGDFLAVSVADTGSGIGADQIASIFEPFYTTKEVGKGTGLGLSQVFGFTKQSGGEVDVSSELGYGAVFTLYLPRVEADTKPAALAPLPALAEDAAGLCILIVEDNETVGRFADEMLRDLGYKTLLVGSAGEALSALHPGDDGFDVVFSDVIMPGVNGVELAREIRRLHPDLPVVLTSGYSNVLAQDGAHGFELLRKPYSIEELSRTLRRVSGTSHKDG